MRKPILTALCLAGLVSGCAAQPDRTTDGAGVITMTQLAFATDVREITVGETITFSNSSSRALHVLVAGQDAQPKAQRGAPSFGGASGHRAEVGDRWTTPPWKTPGAYSVTCTLHPSMNLKVVVSERS